MSAFGNPKIVDDGLVFMYDANNKKSHPGEPTVNLVGSMTKKFSNWNGLTGTTEYYTTSNGGQGVKLRTTSSGGVQWYSNSTIYNIQANTQYTISATVNYSGGTPHPNLLYIRQYDGNGQTSEGGRFTTANQKNLGGGWKRIWRTFTTDSTTTHINLQGYEYSAGRTIFIQDLQFEQKDRNTRFAGPSTTRSATQGFKNRARGTSIDVSNTSFDSNGQITFDGTDDYISIDSVAPLIAGGDFSLEAMIKGSTQDHKSIISINTAGGANRALFMVRSASMGIYDGSTWYIGNIDVDDNNWHHVVLSYTHSTKNAVIYVDGEVSKDATTGNQITVSSGDKVSIGMELDGSSVTDVFNGKIDVAKVYNKALTAAEVTRNFKARRSRFGI